MVWSLAFQSLGRRPLRTFLTALGIAVAVGSMVIFLSLGEGLRQVFSNQLGAVGPDIQVSYGDVEANNPFSSIPQLDLAYAAELGAHAERFGITSVTPVVLVVRGGFDPTSAMVFQGMPIDVDPRQYVTGFRLVEGRWFEPTEAGQPLAVVGLSAAERLHLELGDVLRLNPESSFTIIGIAETEGALVGNSVVVPLQSLQQAIGVSDRVSVLSLDLAKPARADEVAAALAEEYPELGFQTRADLLEIVERGLRISDAVRLGISAIALLVGAIAVVNTLLMSVFERTREFAVLRAVGARPRFLLALVLCESILLAVAGAAAGLVLGRLGIGGVNLVSNDLVGLEVALLTFRLALFAVAVALVVGLLAGLLPAARAARVPIAAAMARE
ncbi:MAG TPA: ABC transporter permease [Trueperaceae bacterium]